MLAAVVWIAGCAPRGGPHPPATFDALFPEGRETVAIETLVARVALEPDQDVRVLALGRDAQTSHHLVALRNAESLHRHDRHSLVVVLLRGHGTMRIGKERKVVGQGSTLYVPRGTAHAFHNEAPEPAVAYVVYAPPYDGEDRIPAAE